MKTVYALPPLPQAPKRILTPEEYMLRRHGDWREYLEMNKTGHLNGTRFMKMLISYYEAGMNEIDRLSKLRSHSAPFLIALSVWGKSYTDRFFNYCIPSLIDQQYPPGSIILMHSDQEGLARINSDPGMKELVRKGMNVWGVRLNDDILAMMSDNPNNKYWHLGMTQSLHLAYAKMLGAAYHLMMPDSVYCAGYFATLAKLNKPVITSTNLCTLSEAMCPELDKLKTELSLNVAPDKLIALGMTHIHNRMLPYFMRDENKWPLGHFLVWIGVDSVHIVSPHQTITYMSADMIKRVPERYYHTLDSELDKIIPADTPIYCPKRDDGLAVIELSSFDGHHASKTTTLEEWCKRWHTRIREKPLHRFMEEDNIFPMQPIEKPYMTDEKIISLKKRVREALKK